MFLAQVYVSWHLFELNNNLSCFNRQAFARTDIERNTGPTEIIYHYFSGKISFCVRLRVNLVFFTVSG
ncbi:hypothetical protein D1872_286440 [compost metagenome]